MFELSNYFNFLPKHFSQIENLNRGERKFLLSTFPYANKII